MSTNRTLSRMIGDATTLGKALLLAASAAAARTLLELGSLATASSINNSNWSGTDLSVANGGTGASTAALARTALAVPGLADNNTFTGQNVFPRLVSVVQAIADDGVLSIAQTETSHSAYLIFCTTAGTTPQGLFRARVGGSATTANIDATGATFLSGVNTLNGTTGADGDFTIAADATHLHLENRTGGSITIGLVRFR